MKLAMARFLETYSLSISFVGTLASGMFNADCLGLGIVDVFII